MNFLLDTQIILWAYLEPERLSDKARSILEDGNSHLVFSVVNLWEIAIKRGLKRKGFQVDPRVIRGRMLDDRYEELLIRSQHAVEVDTLPPIHKDPFDRILIAQAMVEGITLLTADRVISQYPGPIQRV
jgi:PIN domain nuclease of toxin-antitoxin system